jgi:hypothetical protein
MGQFVSTKSAEQRFLEKVSVGDGCWEWLATGHPRGYGYFWPKGRVWIYAHRYSYELFVGPIPDGLKLDHLCRNPKCVRPDHLEPVTQRENVLRGEGVAAKEARRDTCSKGHPFDGHNGKQRLCSICQRNNSRAYKQQRRAAA